MRPAVGPQERQQAGQRSRYAGESILVHEFGHTLFEMGARTLKRSLDLELDALYQAAMAAGLWQSTYAATNYREYWAEGVQCWFNANPRARPANGVHGPVATREDLQAYDPGLARFIANVLGGPGLALGTPRRPRAGLKPLQPQRPGVAGHFQVTARHFAAIAVVHVAQAFPVDGTGGTAAVQLLVVDHGLDGVEIGRRAYHPFHRVAGLRQRALPEALRG
jgi:hypothetical protein